MTKLMKMGLWNGLMVRVTLVNLKTINYWERVSFNGQMATFMSVPSIMMMEQEYYSNLTLSRFTAEKEKSSKFSQ